MLDELMKKGWEKSGGENASETPEQRKKRLISEGKATESDYRKVDIPQPVLGEEWSRAKPGDMTEKKKPPRVGGREKK